MMLSKFIVSSYKTVIEIALWLSLLVFIAGGWAGASTAEFNSILGATAGAVLWFILAVVFFGAFLVLGDIRERVKSIEESEQI